MSQLSWHTLQVSVSVWSSWYTLSDNYVIESRSIFCKTEFSSSSTSKNEFEHSSQTISGDSDPVWLQFQHISTPRPHIRKPHWRRRTRRFWGEFPQEYSSSHECCQEDSPLVWCLFTSLERKRRPKSSSTELKQAGTETLSLSVQAWDTFIFVQHPCSFIDFWHSKVIVVLPVTHLGPEDMVIHRRRNGTRAHTRGMKDVVSGSLRKTSTMKWRSNPLDVRAHVIEVFMEVKNWKSWRDEKCCLLRRNKARAKQKTYKSVGVMKD